MTPGDLLPLLLVLQGVLGGVDTIVNHEWIARLRSSASARAELPLHALREATYAVLFIGLGWFEWHGAAAAIIALLLTGELFVTLVDELIENRTRVLPQNERALHVLLTANYGVTVAVLVPLLLDWSAEPGALVPRSHGALSWLLLAFGSSSLAWSALDFIAWLRLSRTAKASPATA